jgi:7-carboxy-7-deazaguanine synthase
VSVYSVKELFLTLQGEGFHAGRAAVFCRFTGCNLWNGRESDRHSAQCRFCDTDFIGTDGPGGGKFSTADQLADHIRRMWGSTTRNPFVVFTGGEPLLQLDSSLIAAVHARGFTIAVETNGTVSPPAGIDWLTVSPKGTTRLNAQSGQELKLVYPQAESTPNQFENLRFEHFFLQPMDGPNVIAHTNAAVQHCLTNPQWRLSMQMHKFAGFP